jgi:hypothetical protein
MAFMPDNLIEPRRTISAVPQRLHVTESYYYTFTYRRFRKNRTAFVTLARQWRAAGVISRVIFDDFSTQLAMAPPS